MIETTRILQKNESTITTLTIGAVFECFILEDAIRSAKLKGHTCIPEGEYNIRFNTEGAMNVKYKKKYPKMHRGMIEIYGIDNFSFVYFHIGNRIKDTLGCNITGDSFCIDVDGNYMITSSAKAYERLYQKLCALIDKGQTNIKIANSTGAKPIS